ncbi:DUF502 domain-containing protein [Desulfococcaceae bacterium HSG8]|nr:DUF502 domain-containing protein [Desulfococcaceae bacterium HSG8]
MKRIKKLIKTSLLGGIVVILPVAISLFIFKWIFIKVTDIIQAPTNWLMAHATFINDKEIIADTLVLITILTACFIVGAIVRTQFGKIIYRILNGYLMKILPGYSMIKEIVTQFVGDKKSPFSSVALVQIFENDTLMTAFITEIHDNGIYTVFIPTGPNPTSGNIYHIRGEYVHHLDVSVEDAMKSIIGCGTGSSKLIKSFNASRSE